MERSASLISVDRTTPGRTVFIVDEDPAVRTLGARALEEAGFAVEKYATAEEFLENYDPAQKGCLLLSVSLPGMDGLELQCELAKREFKPPILVMSGFADVSMAVRAFKAGAVDFLKKPVANEMLVDRVLLALDVAYNGVESGDGPARERIARVTLLETEQARLEAHAERLEESLCIVRRHQEKFAEQVESMRSTVAELSAERKQLRLRALDPTVIGHEGDAREEESIVARRRLGEIDHQLVGLRETVAMTRAFAAAEFDRVCEEADRRVEVVRQTLADTQEMPRSLRQAFPEHDTEDVTGSSGEPLGVVSERFSQHPSFEQLDADRTALEKCLQAAEAETARVRIAWELSRQQMSILDQDLSEIVGVRRVMREALGHEDEGLARSFGEHRAEALRRWQLMEEAFERERSCRIADTMRLDRQLSELREQLHARIEELTHQLDAHARVHAERSRRVKEAWAKAHRERAGPNPTAGQEDKEAPLPVERPGVEVEAVRSGAIAVASGLAEGKEEIDSADDPRLSEIVILDDTEFGVMASEGLEDLGCAVTPLRPEADLGDRLANRPVRYAAINLASYASWRFMRALRRRPGVFEVPLLGYVLAEGGDTGFWLGAVDFAVLPAGEEVIAAIRRLVPPVPPGQQRHWFFSVIGMGSQAEVMAELRAELRRTNFSATLVFDVRQLLDLIPTVQPQTAFFHATSSCLHLFPAIAGLRSGVGAPDLPILFLLDADPDEQEEAFLKSGAHLLARRGHLKPEDLMMKLASAWGPG